MTKTFNRIFAFGLLAVASVLSAFGQQNTLIQTSLSAAITPSQSCFALASVTGINAATAAVPGSDLYIVDPGQVAGELVRNVSSIVGTTVCGRRTGTGSAHSHATASMVLVATVPSWFASSDPTGACSTTPGSIAGDRYGPYVTPVLNINTGNQWLCSSVTGTWVPGFANSSGNRGATVAVASAAGKITPSGPLFHITGTSAITGFNVPVGYNGGTVCAVPDAIFTTTAANNIALASTAVVSKALCWTFESAAAKPFFPSY